MPTREFRPIQLLHPRHWLLWLGIGVAWLLTLNGARSRRILGPGLANLMRITIPRRVHIARVNLNRCFPKLNPLAQRQLLDATLKSTAQGLLETAATWLHPKQLKHTPMRYKGLEHLDIGSKDNGILILGMHLSTLDLAGAALAQKVPFNVMYKRNRNPVFEWLMRRGRGHYFAESIEQTNVRGVIRNLKAGQRVWYGLDQDYGPDNAVFVPFFGYPAATLTAANRIARITQAKVVFMRHYRFEDGSYEVEIFLPDQAFPTNSDEADAALINRHIEASIRKAPEQYWWVHRRFKSTPSGRSSLYEQ